MKEVNECAKPKRNTLLTYLAEIDYERCNVDEKAENLAKSIIDEGVLTAKSYDDATHIACAVMNNASIILS